MDNSRRQDLPGRLDGRPPAKPTDPYWRHLRYAAWQESNQYRYALTHGWPPPSGRPVTATSPAVLASYCKEAPRDYAAIAAARKAKAA